MLRHLALAELAAAPAPQPTLKPAPEIVREPALEPPLNLYIYIYIDQICI